MGKSISSLHVLNASADEVWSYLYDISINNRYAADDETIIQDFYAAREQAGITSYDEDDTAMLAKDIRFFHDYLLNHCKEHPETFYVVPIGKHVSVFSTYFCPPETETVVFDLFGSCPRKILTVDMLDEDFLKMDFFERSRKRTAFAVGTNIEDIYGIVPCMPDAEILKKEFGITWEPIKERIPNKTEMLKVLSEQTGLPVHLSMTEIRDTFNEQEFEKCTFSL